MSSLAQERHELDQEFDRVPTCACGSNKERFPLHDARGIFCAYVCDDCEKEKKSQYRPEIFTDGNYWADEPIEEEW